jgi:hypothetical protein
MNTANLESATQQQITCEFLRRLGFVDAADHNPERTEQLLRLLADACGILRSYGRGTLIDKEQFAMQLAGMVELIGTERTSVEGRGPFILRTNLRIEPDYGTPGPAVMKTDEVNDELLKALRKANQHIRQLCSTVNTLAAQQGLGRKVRVEDFNEEIVAVVAKVEGR